MPGRGVPEDDQRQVLAADRLGSEGWSQALWRNPNRAAARFERQRGDRASRALTRVEGADRGRTDRPPGLRRRSAEGGISPDPQGQEFCSRHRRDSQLGDAPPRATRSGRERDRNGSGVGASIPDIPPSPAPRDATACRSCRADSENYIAPVRNGLVNRSWPMLEPGPWPQMKPTSSPSGSSLSLIDFISVA